MAVFLHAILQSDSNYFTSLLRKEVGLHCVTHFPTINFQIEDMAKKSRHILNREKFCACIRGMQWVFFQEKQ